MLFFMLAGGRETPTSLTIRCGLMINVICCVRSAVSGSLGSFSMCYEDRYVFYVYSLDMYVQNVKNDCTRYIPSRLPGIPGRLPDTRYSCMYLLDPFFSSEGTHKKHSSFMVSFRSV